MTNNEDKYLETVKEEIDQYMKNSSISKTKRRIEIGRLKTVIAKLDDRKRRLEYRLYELEIEEGI